jgi:hypothetical protein
MTGQPSLNMLHFIVAHLSALLPEALETDVERKAFKTACREGAFDTGERAKLQTSEFCARDSTPPPPS